MYMVIIKSKLTFSQFFIVFKFSTENIPPFVCTQAIALLPDPYCITVC